MVMVSAVPVLTSPVASVKPITILLLTVATRSASAMVNVGAVTIPPITPVGVPALAQSRVVETKKPDMRFGVGGPMVIAVKVRVYVPMGAVVEAATATVKEVGPMTAPGVVKMAAGT
jgi:hypothetical protein